MAKKYLINEKGIVRAITTDSLQLEKPLLNENYDIEVHNRNMDKIDSAIQDAKGKIDSNTNLANQALNKANEAFQRGDNVKKQLVDKLISEGLNMSTDNTFEELINNISLGKKWAIGEAVSSGDMSTFNSINTHGYFNLNYFDVSSLGFAPTTVVYMSKQGNTACGFLTNLIQADTNYSAYIQHTNLSNNTTYSIIADKRVFISNSITRLPSYSQGITYSWIAFE